MIIGDCPYKDCDALMMNPLADRTPCYQRLVCEDCKRVVWLAHSRLDPMAHTEEEFLAEFEINEETKVIRERNPPAPTPTWLEDAVKAEFERLWPEFERELLYGTDTNGPVKGITK